MTLATAIRRFLTQLEADGKSPLTLSVYRAELERFARFAGAKAKVESFRPRAIANYVVSPGCSVSADGTRRSTRTLNRTRSVLRQLFEYLEATEVVSRSPARLLKNGRTDRPVPTVLTEAEERDFLAALRIAAGESAIGARDRLLFTLLLRSGMRLTAALALDVEHLHLAEGTAVSQGKHARIQTVYFPKDVVKLLRRHLAGPPRVTCGAVFRSSRGRLSARQAQYRFRAALELAGITRAVTVHSLRHSFATKLQQQTGDLRIVQAALGHRQVGTTEVYAQIGEAEVRRSLATRS